MYSDVGICVRVCVCSALLPADARPRSMMMNHTRMHQQGAGGRVLAVSRAMAWRGVYIALYFRRLHFRRLRTRNLPDITKEQTPVVWRGVSGEGEGRSGKRGGTEAVVCPIRGSSRSERDEVQNWSS